MEYEPALISAEELFQSVAYCFVITNLKSYSRLSIETKGDGGDFSFVDSQTVPFYVTSDSGQEH